MRKRVSIEGMSCEHCVKSVTDALSKVEGVDRVEVSLEEKSATVDMREDVPDKVISGAVSEIGYKVLEIKVA